MRLYHERLSVPASWWLVTLAVAALLGTTLWAGLSIAFAIAIYVVLTGACAAFLHFWGAVTVEVTDTALRAGSQQLPLSAIGEVAAMDVAQTRALRGPQSNPAAYLLIRPYLPESVYAEIAGRPPQRPYWLIGTRNPEALTAAIEDARRRSSDDPAWDDSPGDHATTGNEAPKGRGGVWTEERGTSDEGRRRLKAPRRQAEKDTEESHAR